MQRILVIEDDEMIRALLHIQLRQLGYTVVAAREGNEALALLDQHEVDLVLTDMMMPGKDGIATIKELKQTRPEMKIVAMSGGHLRSGQDVLRVAKDMGVNGTLQKPFFRQELEEALDAVLLKEREPAVMA